MCVLSVSGIRSVVTVPHIYVTFPICITVLYHISDSGITTEVEVIISGTYQVRPD